MLCLNSFNMNAKFLVIEDYSSQYEEPLKLKAGEVVKTGRRFTEDPEWPGWIWCENSSGKGGWVLERILNISDNDGVVLDNYNASELSARAGEIIEGVKKEGGWIWGVNPQGVSGWIPERNVKLFNGD